MTDSVYRRSRKWMLKTWTPKKIRNRANPNIFIVVGKAEPFAKPCRSEALNNDRKAEAVARRRARAAEKVGQVRP